MSLVTGLGLLLLWWAVRDEDAHIEHFGSTLTASLSSQVVEPLIAKDLIHLGVLANRIIELPEVVGATIYTVEDDMLSLSGDVHRGRPFTQPVIHDATIVGYVRLHIDETAFGEQLSTALIVFSLAWICLVPLATLILAGTLGSLPLPLPQSRRRRSPAPEQVPQQTHASSDDDADCVPRIRYLVTVNLFNQLSLTPDRRRAELQFARKNAAGVAAQYNAEVSELSGTGLLLTFEATDSDDRPFHAVCAAFALSRLLHTAETWGSYRLGVHVQMLDPDGHEFEGDESVADAAVLSALAKNDTMVLSSTLYQRIPFPERIVSEAMSHPLLEQLATTGGRAHLASGLADPHQELVLQQVRELSYSLRSTASESTF